MEILHQRPGGNGVVTSSTLFPVQISHRTRQLLDGYDDKILVGVSYFSSFQLGRFTIRVDFPSHWMQVTTLDS